MQIISINPSFYPFQWIIQNHNQNHKSSFLIRQLSISMDNLKIITLSFITWIFGTEIITEHHSIPSYVNHLKCHHISHHTFVYFAFVGQHSGCQLCVCVISSLRLQITFKQGLFAVSLKALFPIRHPAEHIGWTGKCKQSLCGKCVWAVWFSTTNDLWPGPLADI